MTSREPTATASQGSAYKRSGVDTEGADRALHRMLPHVRATWDDKVALQNLNHFANVVDIGGVGIAIATDGVGSKALVAQLIGRYDTIGIDCVAMNVNDLVCVGARPVSMVDYIALERTDAAVVEALAVGLAEGARRAGISLVGGETAQLPDIIKGVRPGLGFDLAGTAIGQVALDQILTGADIADGDVVIGLASSGIHSNGLSLARRALLDRGGFGIDQRFDELGCSLGNELLRPTEIYVGDALALIDGVAALRSLFHITGDGFLNLNRLGTGVGYVLDRLPAAPPIFGLIQTHGAVPAAEMYSVFNMGIGFCAVVGPDDAERALSILKARGRVAQVIGHMEADAEERVHLPAQGLVGQGKAFAATE